MSYFLALLILLFASAAEITNAECEKGCHVPTLIYEDLRCSPKYESPSDCCPKEYDCSHIYQRPKESCHLKGKFYQAGDEPEYEDYGGSCSPPCKCGEDSQFHCPPLLDGCAEDWVGGYPKPGCYLKYDLNTCCASGEICPPFEGNIKCEVNGVTYDEGLKFGHPTQKCTECVCHKGFEGKFEAPFCQKVNCTSEITDSSYIRDYCAPYYETPDSCCPDSWICASNTDGFYLSADFWSSNSHNNKVSKNCIFGDRSLELGDTYETSHGTLGRVTCECIIPPYLTCA